MFKKELLLVKLGGSIITLKHANQPAIRRANIAQIARVIRQQYDPNKHSLILIHGAGSFGHLHAHRYGLALGTKDHPEKMYRAVENQSLDAHLNSELTRLLLQTGLPVVGMPTRSLATNQGGRLHTLETKSIDAALMAGAIPLLHGDMVFDTRWGLSVLSGDVLMAQLAQYFKVTKVFFASDVDGVFSEDPHLSKNATLISSFSLTTLSRQVKLGTSHNKDVTGGLSKKFCFFQQNSQLKKIYFFNGLIPKNFTFVFNQKNFHGTVLKND